MPYKVDYNYLVNCNIEHFFLKSLDLKKKKVIGKKKFSVKIHLTSDDLLVLVKIIYLF